jgi:pullulanase/glycogen debranching enzyme
MTSPRASSRPASRARPTCSATTAASRGTRSTSSVVHDGLTLGDLYRCNGSNNTQAWPYGPSDGGTSTNYSWDQGMSAGTGSAISAAHAPAWPSRCCRPGAADAGRRRVPAHAQLQQQRLQPRLERQLAELRWSTDQSNFYNFAQAIIAFRKAHPALRPVTWYTSSQVSGMNRVARWPPPATGTTPATTRSPIPSMALRSAMPTRCISPITAGRAASRSHCPRHPPARTGTA